MSSKTQEFHAEEGEHTASITATPFFLAAAELLLLEKKEPKKLGSSFLASTSRSLLLFSAAALNFVLESTGGDLLAFKRSVTIAKA
jgi:hypothetical protein